jgi:hypothetical protein
MKKWLPEGPWPWRGWLDVFSQRFLGLQFCGMAVSGMIEKDGKI